MKTKQGPIVMVEDDLDDREIISEIFQSLKISNEIVWFNDGSEALAYLQTTEQQPFLILCDVNLPKMDGFEFRIEINKDERLRKKSIPFIFFSTNARQSSVAKAYDLTVQGYFVKNDSLEELRNTIFMIINYWNHCKHPNS
jgi:CheY-like chemotaxis protein